MNQDLSIGIDIGGTTSHLVIGNSEQEIYSQTCEGINLHNLNPSQVDARLFSLIEKIKSAPNYSPETTFNGIFIGLTSYDSPEDKQLWAKIITTALAEQQIHYHTLYLSSDAFIALKSGTYSTPAMCLISGTGINCYGLNTDLSEYKAGDWGHLLGDQGSAYWLGSKLLRLTVKELDGRQPKTILSDRVLQATNSADINQLIAWAYEPAGIKDIASISLLLSDDAITTLPRVNFILHKAMEQLMASISSVYQKLATNSRIPLVCVGGMFNSPPYKATFLETLAQTTPYVIPQFTTIAPEQGALRLALTSNQDTQFPPISASRPLLKVVVLTNFLTCHFDQRGEIPHNT